MSQSQSQTQTQTHTSTCVTTSNNTSSIILDIERKGGREEGGPGGAEGQREYPHFLPPLSSTPSSSANK